MTFRPMLAPQDDPKKRPTFFQELPFPLMCSYKYDGIRGVPKDSIVLSRTLKALPSFQVQEDFSMLSHFDGEFIEGDPCTPDCYNRTQSHVMSADKPGDIKFYVFDWADVSKANTPFYERLEYVKEQIILLNRPDVIYVEHKEVETLEELLAYEDEALELGFEGIMMRSPIGRYKHNRCTWNDQIIYKLKRFTDEEGVIVGFVEQNTNLNTQEKDERGYAKRSSSKEGLVPAGTLGKFIVDYKGTEITVAPGVFTHKERKYIWEHQQQFLGESLKFRFFGHGIKDLPRFPRAVGLRNPMDM